MGGRTRLLVMAVAFSGFCIAAAGEELRNWKLDDGSTIDAEFVELSGSDVKLKTKDGKIVTTKWSQLPPRDRAYVLQKKIAAGNQQPLAEPAADKSKDQRPTAFKAMKVSIKGIDYLLYPPIGAVSDKDPESPTISGGEYFEIKIKATSPDDIKLMKERFPPEDPKTGKSRAVNLKNQYIVEIGEPESDDARWVFVATVKVGDQELTAIGEQPKNARWIRRDVMTMIRCFQNITVVK